MGYFTACPNIGNIIGDLLAAVMIEKLGMSVMAPVYISAISVLAMSIINIFAIEASSAKEYIAEFKNPLTKSLVYK
jgi:OPA family glycerol-3-phosphate transporter-like MFS transporter 3/OPA family glycerol-3-phosphate transporter-like MFS transporter 1/2